MLRKNASKKSFLEKGIAAIILAALVVWLALPCPVAAKTAHQPGEKPQTKVTAPGVPTLLLPVNGERVLKRKPLIAGVTENDTKVTVYINGTYNGQATVKNDPSGTASFSYTPFLDLSFGGHKIQVRAEKNQGRSSLSEAVNIEVERPYVAPTLFEPVVNDETTPDQPFIVGVALDNALIKIYIDGKLDGEIVTQNDDSGTGHFSYKPFLPLDYTKDHLVYAVAYDKNGKESQYSNVVGFRVEPNKPKKAAIIETPAEETVEKEVDTKEQVTKETEEEGNVLGESEEATKETPKTEEEAAEESQKSVEVAQDENKEDTSKDDQEEKSNTSIIIWVVILVIVIVLIVLSLRGGSEEGPKESPKDKFGTSPKNEPSKEGQKENKGEEGNMPPPPPSSSSY